MHKIMGGSLLLVILLLIFGPFAAGIYFKKNYQNILSFYNSQKNIHVDVIDYQRGWMNSDVTLAVQIDTTELRGLLNLINIPVSELPSTYKLIVKQHVQHGPIIYSHFNNLSTLFALAAIKSEIRLPPEISSLLALIGMPDLILKSDEDLVTLTGKFCNHFAISKIHIHDPINQVNANLNDLISDLCISPKQKNIIGDLVLLDFSIEDPINSIDIKKINVHLDQYQDEYGLWIGNNSIQIPEIVMRESGKKSISINNINFAGQSHEESGITAGKRTLDIHQIEFGNKILGPITLELSADLLNAKTIHDLLNIYENIAAKGEDYQGQFRQQISMTLPNLLNPGTYFKLDKFAMNMQNGKVHMNGLIIWPKEDFFIPDDLHDFVVSAHAQLEVSISKNLMNDIIAIIASRPNIIQQVSEPDKNMLSEVRSQIDLIAQQNAILINELIADQLLTEKAAQSLISMQKELVSKNEYSDEVKQLLLTRKITLITAYQLNWQYDRILEPYHFLEDKMKEYKKSADSQLHSQFQYLLNQGYFSENVDSYTVTLKWEKSKLTANGRAI